MQARLDRRALIAGAGALFLPAPALLAQVAAAKDPFTLGVASGSPTPDGMVLWTRLAPEPLAADGLGGLPGSVPVAWELAADEGFRTVVGRGQTTTDPAFAHTVHVEVSGLKPGRPYWYRFSALGHRSAAGLTRTAPAPGAANDRLKIAVASCSHWELGWFSAYRHMAAERPDLVFFLGDYIYEYSNRPDRADRVRPHEQQPEVVSLTEYRRRYALYHTDPDLQALHAAAPCLATWDDHEVQNDYSNRWSQNLDVSEADFLKRRAAAYRAFWEHMPMRRSALPVGPDARIYGATPYGGLADILLLDGRQYRTIQPCPTPTARRGHVDACPDLTDPSRTMLGWDQETWLHARFKQGRARWTMVAQDLLIAGVNQTTPEGQPGHFTDGWDGYQATRSRMLDALGTAGARNPVFFAGDIHSFWATDLKADYANPASKTVGSEFVGTAIAQEHPAPKAFVDVEARNPHVRYFDQTTNGYFTVDVSPSRLETRFRAISDRRDRAATVVTLKSFVVENGRPGVQLA
jgi:alkaline phosphatase D